MVRIEGCLGFPVSRNSAPLVQFKSCPNPATLFLAVLQLAGTAISSTQAQLEVHAAVVQGN